MLLIAETLCDVFMEQLRYDDDLNVIAQYFLESHLNFVEVCQL